jgi:16S rRNA (cytosine1402-N4)-methyltransferase
MPSTPSHTSVLLHQSISTLNIKPDGIYLDATFGRGGHSLEILKKLDKLNNKCKLFAIDQDPEAIEYANNHPIFSTDKRFKLIQANFSQLKHICEQNNITNKINGILFDFGVSSPQLDQAQRGFSFLKDGPLDMRMNPDADIPASELIKIKTSQELTDIFKIYGEERFAKKIAEKIKLNLQDKPISTTLELAKLIEQTIPRRFHERKKHPATRCFQALRIAVNNELGVIEQILPQLDNIIAKNGIIAFITFHSLEDRIIKHYVQKDIKPCNIPKGLPILDKDINKNQKWQWVIKKQRANEEELSSNPRARSATLRVIKRI